MPVGGRAKWLLKAQAGQCHLLQPLQGLDGLPKVAEDEQHLTEQRPLARLLPLGSWGLVFYLEKNMALMAMLVDQRLAGTFNLFYHPKATTNCRLDP